MLIVVLFSFFVKTNLGFVLHSKSKFIHLNWVKLKKTVKLNESCVLLLTVLKQLYGKQKDPD